MSDTKVSGMSTLAATAVTDKTTLLLPVVNGAVPANYSLSYPELIKLLNSDLLSPVVAVTVPNANYLVNSDDNGKYVRFSGSGVKSLNIGASSTDLSITISNRSAGALTIQPANGVTVNPPANGSLILAHNMTATLKWISTTVYDLIGQTQ